MATPVSNFRLPLALLERVDAARGGESRTSFVIRALEAQLDREAAARPVPRVSRRRRVVTSAEAKAGLFGR